MKALVHRARSALAERLGGGVGRAGDCRGCPAFEADLSALLDEELAPERAAELRAHLETCDHCARRLEELCNVDLVLASLPAPEVASDLRAQLAGRIAEHERRGALSAMSGRRAGHAAPRPPPPRTPRWLGRRVAALAALAAAAVLAVFATLPSGETLRPTLRRSRGPRRRPFPHRVPSRERSRAASRFSPSSGAWSPSRRSWSRRLSRSPKPRGEIAEIPPAPREAAPVEIAETPPAAGLEDLSEEDLAMLLVLDAVEDLDVIANLELLEDLLELEGTEGAG